LVEVIAELCQNHNGDFEILKEMVYAAKDSGATHAKIQYILADMLTFRERFEHGKTINGNIDVIKRPYQNEYDRLSHLELSDHEVGDFISLCTKIGIEPLVTVFTRGSVENLVRQGFRAVKVASYDCGSLPLLKDLKSSFERIIVSTGASYDEEIEQAADVLDGAQFSFLHCVTVYPTSLDQFNLSRMKYLSKYTSSVGWSDHSLVERDGIDGTLVAVYYGAKIIERHFTIFPPDATKDGPVSVNPEQLKSLIDLSKLSIEDMELYLRERIPDFEKCLGSDSGELSYEELMNRDYYRGRFADRIDGGVVYNWEE
jgi:sialic acid synthase SpsE